MMVGGLAFLAAAFSVYTWLQGDKWLAWTSWWPLWVFFGVISAAASSPLSITTHSAGPDWYDRTTMRLGVFRTHDTTIRLYELNYVGIEVTNAMRLHLEDRYAALTLEFGEWQYTRLMWDLVYNGIVHSVANGAKINNRAWKYLWLDEIEGLAKAAGRDPQ